MRLPTLALRRKRPPLELPTSAVLRQPPHSLPILSAEELLTQRREPCNRIEELVGTTPKHFEQFYGTALQRYARFVQQLPASESHHHAYAGGLLDHGLEVLINALKLRQGYLLPPGAAPEDIVHRHDLWTYAVFAAALVHDVAKAAVDQIVTAYSADGGRTWVWNPWIGDLPDEADAHWYRTEFMRNRQYRLHEKASPLFAQRLLGAEGMAWLASDREAFSAWLGWVSGDTLQSGVLGEIVGQADGSSVARDLGAQPSPRTTVAAGKVIPLQEKLITALRFLIDERELPLNRNGAACWRVGDDLWLVSKRTVDALRAHLMQTGHSGIPTQNDRLYDVLQEHGILVPCDDRAIWRAEVAGDGWAHELTLIRIPLARIWTNLDQWPEPFNGQIKPRTLEHDTRPADAVLSSSSEECAESGDTARIATDTPPPAKPDSSPTGADSKPLKQASSSLGNSVIDWVRQGLADRSIDYNQPHARVHLVPEGVLLISPGLFQDYAHAHPEESWETVQKRFFKLGLHQRTTSGTNVHTYQVVGGNRATRVNGIVIPDVERLFTPPAPKPNPHLRPNSR